MISTSVPGMPGWSNPSHLMLPGALRLSPSHGGGLGVLCVFGRGVAGRADHMRPQGCSSAVFLCPVQHKCPTTSRFLVRPPPPRRAALMASAISRIGMAGWGNSHFTLHGALGLSPCHGRGFYSAVGFLVWWDHISDFR
jgi:hypothetical protein